ncbi:MAG: hypothetical protein Edafosvirus1_16 [Edafosvirus sp.]|uniref:Uncharacterized protein n=1 Tax=Edafosvirus sp. TaxID=2487765 RepID=A0A3G4ZS32_9VIRU|nr:MAG: hypothetical protein Edafosvirus1_16 [Edafosvirus sp.]
MGSSHTMNQYIETWIYNTECGGQSAMEQEYDTEYIVLSSDTLSETKEKSLKKCHDYNVNRDYRSISIQYTKTNFDLQKGGNVYVLKRHIQDGSSNQTRAIEFFNKIPTLNYTIIKKYYSPPITFGRYGYKYKITYTLDHYIIDKNDKGQLYLKLIKENVVAINQKN